MKNNRDEQAMTLLDGLFLRQTKRKEHEIFTLQDYSLGNCRIKFSTRYLMLFINAEIHRHYQFTPMGIKKISIILEVARSHGFRIIFSTKTKPLTRLFQRRLVIWNWTLLWSVGIPIDVCQLSEAFGPRKNFVTKLCSRNEYTSNGLETVFS